MSAEQPSVEALQAEVAALRARVAELEQGEQVLRAMAAASPDFIVVVDRDGRHLDVLPTRAPIADRSALGRTFHELRPSAEADRFLELVRAALSSGERRVEQFPGAGEQAGGIEVSVLPIGPDRALWVARDISSAKELERAEGELRVFKEITDKAPDGVHLVDMEGQVRYSNRAWAAMAGRPDGGVGAPLAELLHPDERERLQQALAQLRERGVWQSEWTYERPDGSSFPGQVSLILLENAQGQPQAISAIVRDLSEQRRADEERVALQEQVIDAQRVALREVSTPLIPLADDVVVMPLVGAIDSARAQQIMEVLLEGIAQYQAETVLVDISGVRVVDTQVADALLRAARAVQLLGAQIILTGISAEVAQTIVHLGADMGRIMTRANLQDGLRYALEERAR